MHGRKHLEKTKKKRIHNYGFPCIDCNKEINRGGENDAGNKNCNPTNERIDIHRSLRLDSHYTPRADVFYVLGKRQQRGEAGCGGEYGKLSGGNLYEGIGVW